MRLFRQGRGDTADFNSVCQTPKLPRTSGACSSTAASEVGMVAAEAVMPQSELGLRGNLSGKPLQQLAAVRAESATVEHSPLRF